jgi:hypothetical protein
MEVSSWSPKMSTTVQRQIARSNEDALAAFDDTLNETVVRAVTNQTAVTAYLELLITASPA